MFLSKNKKKTKIRASNPSTLVLKVVKSLSMKVSATTISSYGVYAKIYGQWIVLKLSGLTITKSKSELNLKVQNLELLTLQISRNYFQAMIFSLNEIFLLYLVILCRSFCSYICRIHAKTGRGALPVL